MPLTTRCDHCGRLFPVYAQALKRRRGRIDCPQCGKRFDAVAGLIDEVVPGGDAEDPKARVPRQRPEPATAPASLMSFEHDRAHRTGTLLWSLGLLLLLAGLAGQLFWWERGIWLRFPEVRQVYEQLCAGHDGCPPLPRLAGTMEILQPVLAEHPARDGVLKLDLTLVNHSEQLQRPPVLELELYDGDGEMIAVRRFAPSEYMQESPPPDALDPGSAANVALLLTSPPTPPSGFRIRLY